MDSLAVLDRANPLERTESPADSIARTRHPERLSALSIGQTGTVLGVGCASAHSGTTPGSLPALDRRLLELGFVPGERVEVLAEARPGRDPFVVRVGSLTLALRRREAESIWVGGPADEP